ncbi:MAG: esterase [Bacteroidota bacterium]|jgi:acetyl esterase/lipase|nr:esterase [Bacteroidota bacterium]
MKIIRNYFLVLLSALFLTGSSSCRITKHKNITYLPEDRSAKIDEKKLDVFAPKDVSSKKDVLIFLHGGGWSHGKKSLYSFFGKRLARKDVVGVIVSYPLSPDVDWNGMAEASAKAVKWVKENIDQYGGDPSRVFISGHSAGGHLSALITVKEEYFNKVGLKDPVKGVILIDAAGLDMFNYLKKQDANGDKHYQGAFSSDPANWKKASPIYFLHKGIPPMLILTGEKTYPNIKESNQRFIKEFSQYRSDVKYIEVKRKRHIPMIFQFYNSHNKLYNEMLSFMKEQK